ncbi:EF-hand domain-containing protein [Actinomadura kijaniata]|uniref:EF-hand domain-containing protein n=1 Tax=Actinomadura kijaniata TaxID=46161 RepID=UPI000832F169|nr:EF-hand domain-containing protein [Actinomadura kijaniata]
MSQDSALTEAELREAFDERDLNRDGYISRDELRRHLLIQGRELTLAQLDERIARADTDGDGRISFEDFVKAHESLEA